MFSIIIPIYNAALFLLQCLDSIARQTYTDFEVIMVDDGSTDDSAAICKKMQQRDSRFMYVYKENGGVSSARNLGIDKAKGEWISFVDADDWFAEDYLKTFMSTTPKADITFFGETSMKDGVIQEQKIHPSCWCCGREEVEKAVYSLRCGQLGDVFGWTWDKFFRADIISNYSVRFPENISFREDEIFTLEYCRYINTLRIIDKSLYFYRILDTGLTKRGMTASEYMPSAVCIEHSMSYYSYPPLYESLLATVTDYRAKDIYTGSWTSVKDKLLAYQKFVTDNPQPGILRKVNHLTQYLHKGFWAGYLYCLLRRI
ncbi:MAG: glycosyltransferase [Prevotellaceae bacterium]|nr:glycosyltransferase [Prevotellaceae bacterium]